MLRKIFQALFKSKAERRMAMRHMEKMPAAGHVETRNVSPYPERFFGEPGRLDSLMGSVAKLSTIEDPKATIQQ